MPNLSAVLRHFPGQRILTIGDVILDRYWWGEASRLSPEAPVPVVRKQRSTVRPGGAANTAANLAALGAVPLLVGLVGTDRAAVELQDALLECGVGVDSLISETTRPTTTKTRVIASHQQIVRVDEEDVAPISRETEERARIVIAECLEAASAVVVSDYAKGFLSPTLLNFAIAAAGRAGKRVFVDPKGADYNRYQGCFLMKPNRLELSILTGLPARNHEETLLAGSRLSALMPGAMILVTEGADGMTLFADSRPVEHHAPAPRQVYDVTGAGDTVLATLSLAIAAGASYRDAMKLAAEAAAIAIGTMGTATVKLLQLETALSDVHGIRSQTL
ncbi:MAG: PfkB family carbohydrate kinase [Candidatus Solibacter sp.]|nr:PfkB family carbohydrate kinase [Candidatus Solibacter sp.]